MDREYSTLSHSGVKKIPIAGGTPATLATGGTDGTSSSLYGIAVDGSYVYWGNGRASGSWDVMKVPIAGGSPVTLATGQGSVGSVAVDSTYVYWTSGDAVKKARK